MPPDVDAYAAAVAGRALASKCRGGYTAAPAITGEWFLRYVVRPTVTTRVSDVEDLVQSSNWDGGAYGIQENQLTNQYSPMPLQDMFRSPRRNIVLREILLPQVSTASVTPPFESMDIPASIIAAGSTVTLRAYRSTSFIGEFSVTIGESSSFAANGVMGYRLRSLTNINRTMTPGLGFLYRGISISTAPSAQPDTSFEFYGRLESGVGSVLEVDSEGNQIEVQTVNLTCRYDARFRVGDWLSISDLSDYRFRIFNIENTGRRKWQTMSLRQEIAS